MAARLVVRQALHHNPVTLHPDGANFAEIVERLAFKNHAAAGSGVVVLLQPAGSTTEEDLKKKTTMNKSYVSSLRNYGAR